MTRNRLVSTFVIFIFVSLFLAVTTGCDDPPGYGALVISISHKSSEGTPLEGLESILVVSKKVAAVMRSDPNDPATEYLYVATEEEQTIELGGLQIEVPREIARFQLPVGHVMQVRLVCGQISMTISGQEHDVKLPSGPQTGLKIEPIDGVPFEIQEEKLTGARVIFDPATQVILNRGVGYIFKPVILAEHVPPDELYGGMIADQLVVRFKDGTTLEKIENANNKKGFAVMRRFLPNNYYTLKIPTDMSLRDALLYYDDLGIVKYVLPNTWVYSRQNDPNFPLQWQLPQVSAPATWALTPGDRNVVVAVIEGGGVDLNHEDLINNLYLNEEELPPRCHADDDGDGFRNCDFDQDGLITFNDFNPGPLNPTPLAAIDAVLLSPGFNINRGCNPDALCLDPAGVPPVVIDCVEPGDLLDDVCGIEGDQNGDGCPGVCGADDDGDGLIDEDEAGRQPGEVGYTNDLVDDDDENGYPDDFVGWNFQNANNDPTARRPVDHSLHGTMVAGVLGAVTNNGIDGAGTTQQVRQMIVRSGGPYRNPRDGDYFAIEYAINNGADIINASWGYTLWKKGVAVCDIVEERGVKMDDGDKFKEFRDRLIEEWDDHDFDDVLWVGAVENCQQDEDNRWIFDWPPEINKPNMIAVTASDNNDNLSNWGNQHGGAFGRGVVDIAAPGDGHFVLSTGGGSTDDCHLPGGAPDCNGTSFATPMVAATAALILAWDPTMYGRPVDIKDRILRNADPIMALRNLVPDPPRPNAIGGARLNTLQAVLNLFPP